MCKVKRQPDEMMSKTRKHLYIIFDDWESGFSIRKIDLDTDQLIPGGYKAREVALPPPSIRFRAECSYPIYFSDAIGSKILAMHPKKENNADRGAFCFDVHNRRLNCIPRHTDQFRPIYFPIGNRLFALGNFSLEILDLQPLVSRSSQLDALSWHKLKDVPVDSMFVISHAVLPDSQTIFVSVGITTHTTHSLHVGEDGSFKWTNHGEWILPFDGCGFFDPKLNTWVGLALYKEKPGRICSCNLASVTSKVRPDVKYTEECLFSADPAETNVGATLVYMGHSSKYCLVECIEVGNKDKAPCMFLRLTMFSLKCNESGDLTLGDSRRVRYFKLPKKEISESLFLRPQAFWL